MTDQKARESKARRQLDRRGLRLEKTRRRHQDASDYGTYQIVDAYTNFLVLADRERGYGLSLEDVEEWIAPATG